MSGFVADSSSGQRDTILQYIQRVVLAEQVWLGREIAEMGNPGKETKTKGGNTRRSRILPITSEGKIRAR